MAGELGARCLGFVHVDMQGIPRICNGPVGLSTLYRNSDMGVEKALCPHLLQAGPICMTFSFSDTIVAVLLLAPLANYYSYSGLVKTMT